MLLYTDMESRGSKQGPTSTYLLLQASVYWRLAKIRDNQEFIDTSKLRRTPPMLNDFPCSKERLALAVRQLRMRPLGDISMSKT
jgi:hypothetical protein